MAGGVGSGVTDAMLGACCVEVAKGKCGADVPMRGVRLQGGAPARVPRKAVSSHVFERGVPGDRRGDRPGRVGTGRGIVPGDCGGASVAREHQDEGLPREEARQFFEGQTAHLERLYAKLQREAIRDGASARCGAQVRFGSGWTMGRSGREPGEVPDARRTRMAVRQGRELPGAAGVDASRRCLRP